MLLFWHSFQTTFGSVNIKKKKKKQLYSALLSLLTENRFHSGYINVWWAGEIKCLLLFLFNLQETFWQKVKEIQLQSHKYLVGKEVKACSLQSIDIYVKKHKVEYKTKQKKKTHTLQTYNSLQLNDFHAAVSPFW